MAYTIDKKTGEITIGGFEQGIAVSPHKGIANIQAGNISTESGEVLCSYARVQQSQVNNSTTGTLSFIDTSHLSASFAVTKGVWIQVTNSSNTGQLPNANYWITLSPGSGLVLATTYGGSGLTGYTAGLTANFSLIRNMSQPVASATEKYSTGTAFKYRYYVLDSAGLVWVYDSATADPTDNITWVLPDTTISYLNGGTPTGLTILNGWLMVFAGNTIWCKSTVLLSSTPGWNSFAPGIMVSPVNSPNPHFAFTGHQGKAYYTDGNFIGSIFPNTSLLTGAANIQSYASYTAVTTTGTISTLIDGSLPTTSTTSIRIPAVFFTAGTKPAAITVGTIYYIQYSTGAGTFEVYSAASGGSALDIQTGAVGTQYFNTFYPISAGGSATITFTPQRLNLPFFETATCIAEIGNNVLIGTKSNALYPWNQVDVLPGDLIPLPENNTVNMITVNNMVYVFSGAKGNIYITNGSTASLVLSVPDYTAGIAGTPSTYVEPYFTWGGAMYLRGRVYFSVLDQTSSKSGNCGGVWSFVPTQNFFIGQDTGLSLRMENKNSYGTFNGVCTILIPSQDQNAKSPQYWSGWYSSITSPSYGIDFTDTTPSTVCVIETDLIPTGTLLDKKTFSQIEYKLSTPLVQGEAVTIKYRQNVTDAFTSFSPTTAITESSTGLSGYYPVSFEKGQWLQLQITLTPVTSASSSFVRLKNIYVR